MDHVAIMKKSWGFTEKILDGRKKIESRWYMNKYRPWDAIKRGDDIYFKNSGEPVRLRATAKNIVQISNLNPARIKRILAKYGRQIGIEKGQTNQFFKELKGKKYCVLVFLANPVAVDPFEIDKTGFGAMSSWIVVKNIQMIKKDKIIVAVSGGMDPIHPGHVRLFKDAKKLGDELVVIVNNDNWLRKKKGYVFMSEKERKEIIGAIKGVDRVVLTSHKADPSDMSVCTELKKVKPHIFANGGDRTERNVPELAVCKAMGCKVVFNVGCGGKIASSSKIVANFAK